MIRRLMEFLLLWIGIVVISPFLAWCIVVELEQDIRSINAFKNKKEEKMKNRNGFTELGVVLVQGLVIVATYIGGTGVFSSNPETLGFSIAVQGLTAYSQTPHVKRDFREELATKMGIQHPESMSDVDLLVSVKDDGNKTFYTERWEQSLNIPKPTNGGGLRARILALQY